MIINVNSCPIMHWRIYVFLMTYITLWVPPLVTKVLWAHWSMFVLCRHPFVSRQHSILIVGWVTSITSFVSPQNCLYLNDHQELFSIGHTKILLTNCLSVICLYYLIQWCIVITISICVLISLSQMLSSINTPHWNIKRYDRIMCHIWTANWENWITKGNC